MCSTPGGIGEVGISFVCPFFHARKRCSTPGGIGEVGISTFVCRHQITFLCSTPGGIGEVGISQQKQRLAICNMCSAQRLVASERSAYSVGVGRRGTFQVLNAWWHRRGRHARSQALIRSLPCVLNAWWHRRGRHGRRLCTVGPQERCSTPGGIGEVGIRVVAGDAQVRVLVLNAWWHRRGRHNVHRSVIIRSQPVLNAWWHRRGRHGREAAFTGLPKRRCSTPGGIGEVGISLPQKPCP